MINNKTVFAVILARGGSKGVPRKNIRSIAGKPLIAWTIEAALNSRYIDQVITSSDDDEIIEIAKKYGSDVPFKRPAQLAEDSTPNTGPILHAIENVGSNYDYVVFLQPTTPLRGTKDIDGCIKNLIDKNGNCSVSLTQQKKPLEWHYKINNQQLTPLLNTDNFPQIRQQAEEIYVLNGCVYVAKTDYYLKHKTFLTDETLAYVMPEERSIDIDTELDMLIAETLLINRFQ